MTDRNEKLGIIVDATDNASGKLSNVKREISGIGNASAGSRFGGFVQSIEHGASRIKSSLGGALSTFGGRLKQFGVGLAAAAGVGGLLSITGAFEQGIGKAQEMALAVEKVSLATGLAAHPASQLVAVFGKFGISANTTATLLGRLEKNAFAASATSKLAAKFQTEYGFSVRDSAGHVKDANALLLSAADYFNRNTNAAQRDAAMAKLFGKTWLDLAPVLKLGSKGIKEAAAEADNLGLTLKSAQDVKNVHDFIAAQRDAKDALAGVEVQLGLLVMPDLTKGFKEFASYIASHQADIKHVFSDALTVAEHLGAFITGTVVPDIAGLAGAASKFWNGVPAPLRSLLVGAVAGDRLIKFFFGISPIQVVAHLAESALSSVGSTVAKGLTQSLLGGVQKVWVVNLGPGGLGGAGGAAPGLFSGGIRGILGRATGGLGAALGGGAGVGAAGLLASGGLLVAALTAVQKLGIEPGQQRQAGQNITATQAIIASGDPAKIAAALQGVKDSVNSLDPLKRAMYELNAQGVKTHAEGLEAALAGALAAAQAKSQANLQPLPDNISKKQKANFDAVRASVESSRIATVGRINATKSSIDTARIDQVAATRTGDSAIVAAIRGIRMAVSITVPITVPGGFTRTVTTKTGTTMVRIGGNAARGALIGAGI